MDDNIYSLLLKSAQGVTLLGTLRYLTDFAAVAAAAGPDTGAPQQQTSAGGIVYPARGTITIPLLTGATPVPLGGRSVYVLMGEPVLTLLAGTDPARPLQLQFNPIDVERLAGGLVWRPGAPVQQVLSFLGRRLPLPA